MILLRVISFLCCSCSFLVIICIYITRTGDSQTSALRRASNVPIMSNYTHNFIDSRARAYDKARDAEAATCTICFDDFAEDPGNLIAELKCSH